MGFRRKTRHRNTAKKMASAAESVGATAMEGATVIVQDSTNVLKRGWARLSRRRAKATDHKEHRGRIVDEVAEDVREHDHDHVDVLAQTATSLPKDQKRSLVNRGMDRLRRSFRKSFHIGQKSRLTSHEAGRSHSPVPEVGAGAKPNAFQPDEASVRNGSCHFQVKYLGSCEVFDSRGMETCENALRHLRSKNRAVKAILYVSGEALQVVDQESNRGLIVDQTVEKVSFCAPDRSNDKGFAYICRDGATKRWMCHGFSAVKETGERLSHAVGCSFAICLEKKRKREAEMAVYMSAKNLAEEINSDMGGPSRQNQAYSSFRRQLSIAERRQDPQKAILADPLPRPHSVHVADTQSPTSPQSFSLLDELSKPRPAANPNVFDRQQSSFRVSAIQQQSQPQFKRFNSLRMEMGAKNNSTLRSLHNEPIYEGDEDWPGSSGPNQSESAKTTTIPTSNSANEFVSMFSDANKENGTSKHFNRPQSAILTSSNCTSSTSSQLANQWLAEILQASTPTSPPTSAVSSPPPSSGGWCGRDCTVLGPPPAQPPPPLPPQSVLLTPQRSLQQPCPVDPVPATSTSTTPVENDVRQAQLLQPSRKSSADKRKSIEYQILEETDAPPQSPPRVKSQVNGDEQTRPNEVDMFGQPVFNPAGSTPPSAAPSTIQPVPAFSAEPGQDPFDVQWTDQVLESARSAKITGLARNPFSQEGAPVNV